MDSVKPCPTLMSSSTCIDEDGMDYTKPSYPITETPVSPFFHIQFMPKKYVTSLASMDDPDTDQLTSENHLLFQDLQSMTEVMLRTSPGLRRRYIREHSFIVSSMNVRLRSPLKYNCKAGEANCDTTETISKVVEVM